jgi:hypothetical protein
MSSTVTVTARCASCQRILATWHGVPRGPDGRSRLATTSGDLLAWHKALLPTCKAAGLHFSDRAEPR